MALLDEETDNVKSNINRRRVVSLRRRRSAGGSGGGGGTPETATEPTLFANALTDTEVRLWWPDQGTGYTYDVQRATDAGFTTGLTNLLTDAAYPTALADSHTYADTGLTAFTDYYYRVRAKKSGQISAWVTDIAKTIFASSKIVTWLEPAGAIRGVDNAYGNIDSSRNIVSLKSIINTSGATFTKVLGGTAPTFPSDRMEFVNPVLFENGGVRLSCTRQTLSGDFIIFFEVNGQLRTVLEDTGVAPNTRIQTQDTVVQVRMSNNTIYQFLRPVNLDPTRYQRNSIIIRRVGTQMDISIDGGSTWTASQNVGATTFSFDTILGFSGNASIQRLVITNTSLTSAEIEQIVNYEKRPTYAGAQVPSSINLKGLTYSTSLDGNGYLVGAQNEGLQWFDQALWGFGTTHHVMYSRGPSAYQNRVRFYNESQFTNEYVLPITESSGGTPGHSIYSFYPWNGNAEYFRPYAHYDQNGKRDLITQVVNKFDYNSVPTYYPYQKGVVQDLTNLTVSTRERFVHNSQYFQESSVGNIRMKVFQAWNVAGYVSGLGVMFSTDGGNSWSRFHPITMEPALNGGITSRWIYHHLVYNGTNNEFTIFFHIIRTGPARGVFAGAIKCSSSDLYTWRNLSETWSKNVRGGSAVGQYTSNTTNAITIAEMYANCGFEGAALDTAAEVDAQTGHTYITCPFQDSDGVRYACYLQDGTFKMVKVVGTTITTHTINTGRNFVNNVYGSNSYGVIVRTGTDTYDAYLPENTNSDGRHQIGLSRTTDGGTSWNFIGVVTARATDRHDYLVATRNMHYNSAGIIACRSLANPATSGEGDIWIRKVK